MTDQQILIEAIERAGAVIAEHRARDPEQTINRLIAVLDTQVIAGAMTRLKAGFGLKVVK
jgi:putative N-acetylmannosamine-6-phosphate epimerase